MERAMGRACACNRVELSLALLQWLVDRQAKFYLGRRRYPANTMEKLHLVPFMPSPLGVHTRQPTRFGTREPLLLTKIHLEFRPWGYRARHAQLAVPARKLVRRLVTQDVLCALARLPPEQCELALAFED
eukprot:scaffold24568_cov70-Phaeocystis_antarctica.AAC.7